jgi:hypothetical protein
MRHLHALTAIICALTIVGGAASAEARKPSAKRGTKMVDDINAAREAGTTLDADTLEGLTFDDLVSAIPEGPQGPPGDAAQNPVIGGCAINGTTNHFEWGEGYFDSDITDCSCGQGTPALVFQVSTNKLYLCIGD